MTDIKVMKSDPDALDYSNSGGESSLKMKTMKDLNKDQMEHIKKLLTSGISKKNLVVLLEGGENFEEDFRRDVGTQTDDFIFKTTSTQTDLRYLVCLMTPSPLNSYLLQQ